ncbi:MAG: FlgD immunoglobulin-like domain containing protein, partial [Armatimonadota bacterium]
PAPAPSPDGWRWIIVDPEVSTVEGSCSITKVFMQRTDTTLYFKVETAGRTFDPTDTALYIYLDTDFELSTGAPLFNNFGADYLVILGESSDGVLKWNGEGYEYVSELTWQKTEGNVVEVGLPLESINNAEEFCILVELHDDQLFEVDKAPDESFVIITRQPAWLKVEPLGGVADAGQEVSVTITIDSDFFDNEAQVVENLTVHSNDPNMPRADIPIKVNVQPPSVPFERATGLFMISLPITVDKQWHEILGISEEEMKLAIYSPTDGRYRLYKELTSDERKPKPGAGVWVKLDNPVQIKVTGTLPRTREPFVINLQPGWQIIGVPWQTKWTNLRVRKDTEELSLLEAADRGWVADVLWTWDNEIGDYMMVWAGVTGIGLLETLDITKAYWILALTDCQLVIPPKADAMRGIPLSRKRLAENGFVFGLTAEDGQAKRRVWLGFVNATLGRGRNGRSIQAPLPPNSPEASNLQIAVVGDDGNLMAMDLKAGTMKKIEWDVIVRWAGHGQRSIWGSRQQTNPDEIILTWDGLGYLPKGMSAFLVDSVTGARRYMRTQSSYLFRPQDGETERRFKVILEQGETGLLRILNLRATPVRGQGVTIQFALTKPATTKVEILTITGRQIAIVEAGQHRTAGQNTSIWRGVDGQGRKLPVGVYLVRVHAQDEEGRQVQAVTTVNLR